MKKFVITDPGFLLKKKMMFFSLFLFVKITAWSQTLDFKNYTTNDGLITDEVYNLHQDNKGYLWVFSKYGTLKYNGLKFKPVLRNLPFKDSFIYAIYENKRGQKWIANSNAKIYEVKNDSAFIINGIKNISTSLKNSVSEIVKLFVDDSLDIYAITKGKSYRFIRKKDGLYSPLDLSENLNPIV